MKKRSAFSDVISTMILSSILLTVMVVTTSLANDILKNEIVSAEFGSAKNLMKTIDSEMNSILFNPGSTSAIKNSFAYSAPGYTKTGRVMNITFTGKTSIPIQLNYFNIESMPGVGGSFDYTLQGSDSLIMPSYEGTIGRIYISKPYNWRVSLDYKRALYTFTGIIDYFNGTQITKWNTVEVFVVEMDFPKFEYTGSSILILKNERILSSTFSLTGNWSLTVSTVEDGSSNVSISEIGGNPANPSLIKFHKIYVSISSMGGI